MRKFKKLRLAQLSWKLAIDYALIFALVLVLLNAAVHFGVKFFLLYQATQKVESISKAIEVRVIGSSKEHMELDDPEILFEAKTDTTIDINIADANGNLLNSSQNFNSQIIPITDSINSTREIEVGKLHLIVRNTVIKDAGQVKAYIQVASNLEKEYSFLKILFILMVVADAVGILLSLFAGYVVSRKMLRPIDRMTKTAQKIGMSDLTGRIEVPHSNDELSRLAETFNEMLDRIKTSFDEQGRFVADASHELRTPVSIIQGYIEVMDRWGKQDKMVLQESIDAIKEETSDMTGMIERLLFLARGDSGSQILKKSEFSMDELLDELYKESAMLSPQHEFIFNKPEHLNFFGDRKMIKQMIRALLDNSIKFTPSGGEIEVSCSEHEKNIKIVIRDNGIGISEEEKEHVFERFYRVDKARARETGGSGLGLSIVKWIVDAHEGDIFVDSLAEKGTKITIVLPLIN
ncbi:MAG: sensor histidine kinase [Bacillota bacterium]